MSNVFVFKDSGTIDKTARRVEKRLLQKMIRNVPRDLDFIAASGVRKAKILAPRKTGALWRGIWKKSPMIAGKRYIFEIHSSQPRHPTTGTRYPYHIWINWNLSLKGKKPLWGRTSGGGPKYMDRTKSWLKRELRKQMDIKIRRYLRWR